MVCNWDETRHSLVGGWSIFRRKDAFRPRPSAENMDLSPSRGRVHERRHSLVGGWSIFRRKDAFAHDRWPKTWTCPLPAVPTRRENWDSPL